MDEAVGEVEKIIDHPFKNKKLLEDALNTESYKRLEFLGDVGLGFLVSKHIYLAYPKLDQGKLTKLRSANVSNERFARVAVWRGLHTVLRLAPDLDLQLQVKKFAEAVGEEDTTDALYGGRVKAPKVLANVVESIAAAVLVDVDFDLKEAWRIFERLLRPMVTHEDLQKLPQPISMLFEHCQKQHKQLYIEQSIDGSERVASVYVDNEFIVSARSDQKEIARLDAATLALLELPTTNELHQIIDGFLIADEINVLCEIEAAQEKLNILCDKMKWSKPDYKEMKKEGPPHKPIYVYSVQIPENGDISYEGDEKLTIRDAKNSAASHMIRSLSDDQKANRIQVSDTEKPLFFYINLAKRYMQEFNEVKLSALGECMSTVVTIAEILKNNGLAIEKKVTTSSVDMKNDSKGGTIQKSRIEVVLGKTLNFDELMVTASDEAEFEEAVD
ncbi:hypothetical protein UlMin_003679 [Ulmus minor]